MSKKQILLIEDDQSLREVLETMLRSEGFVVESFECGESAIEAFSSKAWDCVLADFRLPKMSGIEVLQNVRRESASLPFILMTAYGSIDIAVEALKQGANDFLTKPLKPEQLLYALKDVLESGRIIDRNHSKQKRPRRFISEDKDTQEVIKQAERVASFESSVFITGESGTGKELLARHIHERSPRAEKPFIAVNCAALPAELLESEFFGHEEGAFTGATQTRVGLLELASEGTIFLDEVAEMPASLQVKLLRALQENEVRRVGGSVDIAVEPRIIAATNRNIEEALKSGELREDFYFRIAVIDFHLKPLRERPNDVESLAEYFLNYFAARFGREKPSFSKGARSLLKQYPWPGNARELENAIERALVLAGDEISPDQLGVDLNIALDPLDEVIKTLPEIAQKAAMEAEREVILKALSRTDGNKTRAAKQLGVSYKTLLNKIRDYEIARS